VSKTKQTGPKGPAMSDGSRQAKRLAAAILEVLGGARLPSDAANALSISLPRYYQLETRALSGLLQACEPRAKGRVRSVESELASARRQIAKLSRECARQQALVRLAQRAVGLASAQPPKPGPKGLRKRRKPTVRALKAAEVLKSEPSGETQTGSAGEQPVAG
jgi:hypothetical protein